MNIHKITFVCAITVVLLPGCMRVASYKPKSLGSIRSLNSMFTYRDTKNNITVAASCLDDIAQSYLLSERNIVLDGQEIKAIHISIYNLSAQDYIISPDEIDITQITYHDIVQSIKTNSTHYLKKAGIVGGSVYGISSGLTFAAFLSLFAATSTHVKAGTVFIYCTSHALGIVLPMIATLCTLPFLGKWIKSAIMNRRIDKDLKEKMLHQHVIIKSGDHYEGLIFIKQSHYKSQFDMRIHEYNNHENEIHFEINLHNI